MNAFLFVGIVPDILVQTSHSNIASPTASLPILPGE
jgi:hypothetical protein